MTSRIIHFGILQIPPKKSPCLIDSTDILFYFNGGTIYITWNCIWNIYLIWNCIRIVNLFFFNLIFKNLFSFFFKKTEWDEKIEVRKTGTLCATVPSLLLFRQEFRVFCKQKLQTHIIYYCIRERPKASRFIHVEFLCSPL